jgi:DNA-binding CsgD family transcriptional regulator
MRHFDAKIIDKGDLTAREAEVLRCLVNAMSDKDIASCLAISIKTVTAHIEHIYTKLGITGERLNRRLCVLRVAMSRGMVQLISVALCVVLVSADDEGLRVRVRSKVSARVSVSRRMDG